MRFHFPILGLVNALKLIQPLKDKYSSVTYADLFQLASATAVEVNIISSLTFISVEVCEFI